MIRILTILLLPLLFFATSCDSGGEGTACSADLDGSWVVSDVSLEFSNDCTCNEANCNDLNLDDAVLENLKCTYATFVGQNLLWDFCDQINGTCDSEEEPTLPKRGLDQCIDEWPYTCTGNVVLIPSMGDSWLVTGNTGELSDETWSVEAFITYYGLQEDWDYEFGDDCSVISSITATKE